MCQMMLRQRGGDGRTFFSPAEIAEVVTELLSMPTFSGLDRDRLIGELESRFTVLAPHHKALGSNDDHKAWLPAKLGTMAWRYWDRYKLFLTETLPDSALQSLDRVSRDVLERLEDPDRPGSWDRRGLVMGHVQSGKTANYIGLVCKAADAGYKVIIVLTGMHSSLRSQTQIRLDEGFLGFKSQPRTGGDMEAFIAVGVGKLDSSIKANTGTNRTEKGDFNRTVANQFGISPGGLPLIFVVKKNGRVLDNLLSWIRSCADAEDPEYHRRYVRNVPMLLIDDEADIASIDTREQRFDQQGKPDPDHNPTEINKLIRKILGSFERVGYVGYTATPFANIYIHDGGRTRELGDDIFPRSFIISIPPASNYFGPARVFGIPPGDDAGLDEVPALPIVTPVSDHADSEFSNEEHGWVPPKLVAKTEHVPLFEGVRQIPPSLREAILVFVMAIAVRRLRSVNPLHNSMLVHVVRYTNPQAIVSEEIGSALNDIVQRLRHGDGDRTPTMRAEFRALWDGDVVPKNHACAAILGAEVVRSLPKWDEVEGILLDSASSIKVRTINGTAGDVLDYDSHKETGLNVVAVGGDKLARGLTLEGLTVSYFLRASRMYDTLMQMGRWFGYRDGYIDLCRLYTAREIIEWFTHIATASEELRREFDLMVSAGGTPKDYGLKVRSHPVLLVTSAVKMRNGTQMRLSYSGDISETITFDRGTAWIARNFSATENWLLRLGAPSSSDGGYTWTGKTAAEVLGFLGSYVSHADAIRANTGLLGRYIRKQNEQGELVDWTILLCSSNADTARMVTVAGKSVSLFKRAEFPEQQRDDRYKIRRLVSPRDELRDLTESQRKAALDATIAAWEADPDKDPAAERPTAPSGRQVRIARPKTRALLMLYPLDPTNAHMGEEVKPIIGLAISFPNSDTAAEIVYTVNNVFTSNGDDDDDL
jgi:hypothetical protein